MYMYPIIISVGPFTIYSFGVFAVLSFFIASFIIWKRGREYHFLEEDIFDAIVLVSLSGLLGARVFYILLNFERFGSSLSRWISFYQVPGLLFVGGLIFGMITLLIISRRKRWDFLSATDVFVTGLSFGQAIGWIGGFLSGFGAGKVSERLGIEFVGQDSPRLPLQLFWVIGMTGLFIFLWKIEERYRTIEWYRGKRSSAQTGFLTFSYSIGMGILMLIIAILSQPSVYWLRFPIEYLVSLVFILTGLAGLYIRSGREFQTDIITISTKTIDQLRKMVVFVRQRERKISLRRKRLDN